MKGRPLLQMCGYTVDTVAVFLQDPCEMLEWPPCVTKATTWSLCAPILVPIITP